MKSIFSNTITAALIAMNCVLLSSGEAMAQSQRRSEIEPMYADTMKAGEPLPILGAGLVLGIGVLLKEHQ